MNTEEFITAIQNRPALWMSSHPQHKFRNVVKKLWEEIKILFPDCPDAKKKWKSLKDMYRKEVKKMPVPRSGDAAITDVEVKWKYFQLLSFIKDEIMPTDGDSNLVVQEDSMTQDSVNESVTLNSDAVISEELNHEQEDLNRTEEESDNIMSQNSPQTPLLQQDATQIIHQTMPSPTASTSTINSALARKRQTPADIRAEYLEIEKKSYELWSWNYLEITTLIC